jgi:hypothetical protein
MWNVEKSESEVWTSSMSLMRAGLPLWAMLWGTQLGDSTFVLHHTYTIPVARHRGVYTTALKALFEDWGIETVLTQVVTVPKLGWKKCKDLNMYALSKKSFEAYCRQKEKGVSAPDQQSNAG